MEKLKGDIFEFGEQGMFDIIVHGCNCFTTMGSGIAKTVRDKYPDAYKADQLTTSGDVNKLGNYTKADVGKFTIINAYTQYNYNRGGEMLDRFEYPSFRVILQKLLHTYGNKRIAFPMIGMGRAGGNRDRIISLLNWFDHYVIEKGGSVTLVEYANVD
jgi:O-acetyl-ADP-ribose deacetylase (regulator of RNase III)